MNEQSKPANKKPRPENPRVIELLRGRGGFPKSWPDEDVLSATEGTILRLSCCCQHAKECLIKAFGDLGKSINKSMKR